MRKKSHFKVYNFEFGTIKETTSTVNIDLDSTQCTHEKLKDITHIAATDDPLFLPLIDIKESKTQILLSYEKRSNLSNLIEIKKEEYPVKISIAQEILAEDILNKYQAEDIYISLNPATLYYYPMQTVRYTYVANQFMPRTQHTTLERYKACVVSILSGISYEKCLNSPEETKKIGNELIKEIYKQPTRMALLAFIKDSKDYITYNYISNNKARLQKTKRKYLGMLALAGVFLVGGVALTQVKATSNRLEIEKSYEERLNRKDLLIEANHHFSEGNYVEAVNKYKKVDYELEKLSKRLIEKEEYQLAIDLDSESLEDVIQQSYITGELEKIVDLSEENLSKKYQSKLKDEKVILSGDLSAMENVLNFLTDEQTAQRLALFCNYYLQYLQ